MSEPISGTVSYRAMLDAGNFVLARNSDHGRMTPTVNGKAFIKVRKFDPPSQNPFPDTKKKDQNTLILVGIRLGKDILATSLHSFMYKELKEATDGFKEELGRGAIYKGAMDIGTWSWDGKARAILTDWAYDCYLERRLDALVDDGMNTMNDVMRLEKLVMIAIWCIQEEPSLRPTMKKVIQMLEGRIIFDNCGKILRSFSKLFRGACSQVAEALAIRQGLMLARQYGMDPLVVESDAKSLIGVLSCHGHVKWEVLPLILDI
ncbi:hypothetical protein HHK36_011995 [Tetracentron sinense]|uniref:RNase H type-1 domain-containing protein n=1 Tax=Tetracentron sinense TaxID=13715 RepID=A0A834ZAM4_TETSI|nr:hypothetical protein HHK36_011995 [Tetracentron sinense]